MVRVDQSERVEAATFAVSAARSGVLGQVGRHEAQCLVLVTLVDDAEAGSRRELGPVGGPCEPLEVVSQELVARRATVHERVGDDGCRVTYGVTHGLLAKKTTQSESRSAHNV